MGDHEVPMDRGVDIRMRCLWLRLGSWAFARQHGEHEWGGLFRPIDEEVSAKILGIGERTNVPGGISVQFAYYPL